MCLSAMFLLISLDFFDKCPVSLQHLSTKRSFTADDFGGGAPEKKKQRVLGSRYIMNLIVAPHNEC